MITNYHKQEEEADYQENREREKHRTMRSRRLEDAFYFGMLLIILCVFGIAAFMFLDFLFSFF